MDDQDRTERITATRPERSYVARRGFIAGMALTAGALLARDEARASDVIDPLAGSAASVETTSFSTRGMAVNGAIAIEEDGANGIWSHTGSRGWSEGKPPMRLRVSRPEPDVSGGQHFMVVPYKYGMALEYNGVIEVWTDDFSVHNNGQGYDVSGARFWVGNHDDSGGMLFTAHRNGDTYGEIVSQLFDRSSGGDLRFGVRDRHDAFVFRSGPENAEVPVARIEEGAVSVAPDHAQEVRVGRIGPRKEAGVAFGRDVPAAIYRNESGAIHATARLVAEQGIGVAGTRPARRLGKLVRSMEVFDAEGASLGFVPIYDQAP